MGAEAVPKVAEEAVHFRWFQLEAAFPQAEERKKMMVEACLFADIADTFAAALPSFLLAVLRAPPAFVARPDIALDTGLGIARGTAPRIVSDIPRLIALRIASLIRAALGASRPAEIRFRADAPHILAAPPVL